MQAQIKKLEFLVADITKQVDTLNAAEAIQEENTYDFQDDDEEVKMLKSVSMKFTSALSAVDQGCAFELIKKLSNFLEETGKLEQNYDTFDTMYA